MKVLGVIVEYNPFHKGHLYHLNESKKKINPDATVAVMSGNFVQRGEPSIIDKYARAEIALKNGVDLVLEIPFVYAVQDAGGFAFGSVGSLHRLGCITDLVFGSESANISLLDKISDLLVEQPENYKLILKKYLKEGLSFPNARKFALIEYMKNNGVNEKELMILEKSNDILGLEYLNALKIYKSSITPHVIQRVGSNYNDENFTGELSSATAIRNLIAEKKDELLLKSLPESSLEIINREINDGRGPVFYESMRESILSYLRTRTRSDIQNIYGIKEGLDERFIESAKQAYDLKSLLDMVKTKRFTYTRVKRNLINIFFNLTTEKITGYNTYGPQYIRVLGFNKKGQDVLASAKKKCKYPIITTPSLYFNIYNKLRDNYNTDEKKYNSIPDLYLEQFKYDLMAANIYSLLFPEKTFAAQERDLKKGVIRID